MTSEKHIAIVDDDADNLFVIEALLSGHYQVSTFDHGSTALQAWELSPPDLIVTDIAMPGMTGTEIIREVRANSNLCDIPVIAITASVGREIYQQINAQGFNLLITKPIMDRETLIDAIESLFAQA